VLYLALKVNIKLSK